MITTAHTQQNEKFPTTHNIHGEINLENPTSQLIRHDLDYFPDLENFLIDEEIQKTIALTLLITTTIWLINTFAW